MADQTRLEFTLDINGQRAQRAISKMEQQFRRTSNRMAASGRTVDQTLVDMTEAAVGFGTEFAEGLKLSDRQLKVLISRQNALLDEIHKVNEAAASGSKEEQKQAENQIKSLEKKIKLIDDIRRKQKGADFSAAFHEAMADSAKELRRATEEQFKGFVGFDRSKMTKAVGGSLKDAMEGLGSRSFGGFAKGLAGAAGGAAKGVIGGLARAGGGEAGLATTLAKMGPALSGITGAIMMIVKLFMDAEAQAKEFHKEILATASTGEFLARAGGDAYAAYDRLELTMKGIRKSAFDARQNLEWGITSKEHSQFLGTLNAEGVTLRRIQDEANAARTEVGQFSADMVHVAVAFSRNFGVSLNDIAVFQSEMMTELGTKATDVASSFNMIHQAATDSGISQNKFFEMIRSVSSDLSLYNTRLEDSVQLLKLVGKAMSPRNAQKFMQETTQGLKNMSRTEKLKLTLLAGPKKTADILEKDFKSKRQLLAEKLKAAGAEGSVEDISAAIEKGGEALESKMAKADVGGDLQEAITQYGIDRKRSSKGTFGQATAAGNLGVGGTLDLYTAALTRFGGGKSLSEGAGSIGMEMMAEQLGISQERLDAMIKVEKAVERQRKQLKKQAIEEGKSAEEIAAIDKMGTQGVIQTMSEASKKDIEKATNVESFAKQQVDLTQTVSDKLQVIADFLLNEIYDIFTGIFDMMANSRIFGNSKRQQQSALVQKSKGDSELSRAVNTKGDVRNEMAKVLQKRIGAALEDANNQVAEGKRILDQAAQLARDGKHDQSVEMFRKGGAMVEQGETRKTGYVREALKGFKSSDQVSQFLKYAGLDQDTVDRALGKEGANVTTSVFNEGMMDKLIVWLDTNMPEKKDWIVNKSLLTRSAEDLSQLASSGVAVEGARLGRSTTAATAAATAAAGPTGGPPPSAKEKPATQEQQAQVVNHLATVAEGQSQMGLDRANVRRVVQPAIENATLEAMRTALFEYYMYSALDRGTVAQGLQKGTFSASTFGKQVVGQAQQTGTVMVPPAHAAGGVVAKPPPGEAFAAVAPGETIVPKGGSIAGGGGGNLTINVNGIGGRDLANFLRQKINEGIYEYKRRERMS